MKRMWRHGSQMLDTDVCPLPDCIVPMNPVLVLSDVELVALLADNWQVFRTHRPTGAYLPIGHMDGDCHTCHVAWPCSTVRLALAGGQDG